VVDQYGTVVQAGSPNNSSGVGGQVIDYIYGTFTFFIYISDDDGEVAADSTIITGY